MKIPKRTKSTRTYKFKLHVDDKFVSDFNNGQRVQRLYFNYDNVYTSFSCQSGKKVSGYPHRVGFRVVMEQ